MALKTSKNSRLSSLVGMSAKLIGQSLKGALTAKSEIETRIEQAKFVAETLSELKGAAMKFGQLLSIQGDAFLPPEVSEILSVLQNAAPSLSTEEILKIISKECPALKAELQTLSDLPLGAASIGQVHFATLKKGDKVAVKVQYPGIADAIDSEVKILEKILQIVSRFYKSPINVPPIVEEVRMLLKQEVNYAEELRYGLYFKKALQDEKHLIVPRFYQELSSATVLTMSFEKGDSLKEFLKSPLTQEEKNFCGSLLMDLLMKEIFVFRTVQTDPNFANYLFRKNDRNEIEIVLLDFGASKQYEKSFIDQYKKLMNAFIHFDREKVLKLSNELGFLSEKESEITKNLFIELCLLGIEPFKKTNDSLNSFNFSDTDFSKKVQKKTMELLKVTQFTPPPADLLFLNRKLGGVFNLFRTIGVQQNLSETFYHYVEQETSK